ncbi:fungal specific transcription factor domain-containing protein [Aspergillus vadensis CBS 113365]|uniref:Zn(2)-C6 fungal-type domain-containing protein n=1 Tax=Aspergillus vadensis (strain CBS 113365 / IMI 142717 / IBT 24658) TaxID=1448311 RepID=A0A319BXA0_ASPVC|nr:hypothetical protein BO88DRAFT_416680 [Aspergillus vadensis CBS 113365]PYH67728.1 hypothetical protein BO88DRAFT_416680 [Aspergillus vadensis CBS 113365]
MAKRMRLKSETQELRAVAITVLTCSKRQKSKYIAKYSGTAPCSYCSRTKKRCRFERVPPRTLLTRKKIEENEQLCEKLMTLAQNLDPNIDIEEALKASPGAEQRHDNNETDHNSLLCVSPGSNDLVSSAKQALDGMASLPSEGAESGDLGKWPEKFCMVEIDDLLPEHPAPLVARRGQRPADSTKLASPHMLRELDNAILTDPPFDAYFGWYNKSFPILHEKTFREKYQNRHRIPPHSTWRLILYVVLGIGDWVVSGGSKVEESRYYMAARSRMSMNLLESRDRGTAWLIRARRIRLQRGAWKYLTGLCISHKLRLLQ